MQVFLVIRCIRSHISFFRLGLTPTLSSVRNDLIGKKPYGKILILLFVFFAGERLYPFSEDFHIAESSIAVTEDTSDLDSDLTGDVIADDEAAGGANGSDESESNGGDIFSEGQYRPY